MLSEQQRSQQSNTNKAEELFVAAARAFFNDYHQFLSKLITTEERDKASRDGHELSNLAKKYQDQIVNLAAMTDAIQKPLTTLEAFIAQEEEMAGKMEEVRMSTLATFHNSERWKKLIVAFAMAFSKNSPNPTVDDFIAGAKAAANQYCGIDERKKPLIKNLEKYIERIESYKGDFTAKFMFPFFKQSRAFNRRANYELAKQLLAELKDPFKSIEDIFSVDLIDKRKGLIAATQGTSSSDIDEMLRGINSDELNAVIEEAKRFT